MDVLLVGKPMHNVRKFIVVTALVFLAVTALYPPWQHKDVQVLLSQWAIALPGSRRCIRSGQALIFLV